MREVLLPQFGMGMTSGTITAWHTEIGGKVREGDILFDVEAEKASVEVPAPCSGQLHEIRVKAGSTVKVREVVAIIDDGSAAPLPAIPAPAGQAQSPQSAQAPQTPGVGVQKRPDPRSERQIEPRARRMALDNAIDLDRVGGTGPGGRVIAEDVAAHLESGRTQGAARSLEVDAEYDGAALEGLIDEIAASRPDITLDLVSVLARLVSLAADRAGVPSRPIVIATLQGQYVDCHGGRLSDCSPAALEHGRPVLARMSVMRSDTIRRFVPATRDEAITMAFVVQSQGICRLCLQADPEKIEPDCVLRMVTEIAMLMQSPIALLV